MWKTWWRGRLQADTPQFAGEARGVFESALAAGRAREDASRELFDQLAFALRMAESDVPIDRATIPLSLAWPPERVKELAGQVRLSPYLKTNLRALVARFREDQRTLERAHGALAALAADPGLHVRAEAVETVLGLFHFLPGSREQFREYPLVFDLLGGSGLGGDAEALPEALAPFVCREPEAESPADWPDEPEEEDGDPAPLLLEIGLDLVPLVDPALGGGLLAGLPALRARLTRALGWVMPGVAFQPGEWADAPQRYRVRVRGVVAAEGELLPGFVLLHETAESPRLDPAAFAGFAARHPLSGRPGVWVAPQAARQAQAEGYGLAEPTGLLLDALEASVRRHAHAIFTLDDAAAMIAALQARAPHTVEAVHPARLDLTACWAVMRRLLREQVPLSDLQGLFEQLALAVRAQPPAHHQAMALLERPLGQEQLLALEALQHLRPESDPHALVALVRRGLSRAIVAPRLDAEGVLDAVALAPDLEAALTAACRPDAHGPGLRLGLAEREAVVMRLHAALEAVEPPVLLVADALRPFLYDWLAPRLEALAVIAYGEIPPEVRVRRLREVSLERA